MVEVNVAKPPPACPDCGSMEVIAYGTPALSAYTQKEFPVIQHGSHSAQRLGNFCPACKQFTLVFQPPDLLFD